VPNKLALVEGVDPNTDPDDPPNGLWPDPD
jgi:hypothetical protein